jgi:hypothetical protein
LDAGFRRKANGPLTETRIPRVSSPAPVCVEPVLLQLNQPRLVRANQPCAHRRGAYDEAVNNAEELVQTTGVPPAEAIQAELAACEALVAADRIRERERLESCEPADPRATHQRGDSCASGRCMTLDRPRPRIMTSRRAPASSICLASVPR